MALNTLNTDAISFKKLNGKAHTQQSFAVTEEGITTNVQSSYSTVFSNSIEPLPVTNSGLTGVYDTNGVVERVKFQVDIIPDTQIAVGRSQGYRLKLPADYNVSGELFPQFSAGTYLHNALGKLQIVPSLYGQLKIDGTTEYDPILYQTNGSTVIAKFDPINWILDPYNGILFVQDPPTGYDTSASRPGFVEAFLYVGDYLDDVIFSIASGATGTTGQNVGGAEGIFKDTIAGTGGTTVLRFKTLFGTNGIAVTGDSDNVFITFSGASGGGTITGGTNGLSTSGANIVLGGLLTGNTEINSITGTSSLAFGSGFSERLDNFKVYSNSLNLTTSNFTLSNINDTASITLDDNPNVSITTSEGIIFINTSLPQSRVEIQGGDSRMILSGDSNISIQLDTGKIFAYAADYSSNFTPRSFVDKAYVTGLTSSVGLGANGLSKIGNYIVLGGTLTGNTTIDLTGNTLTIERGRLTLMGGDLNGLSGATVDLYENGNMFLFAEDTISSGITGGMVHISSINAENYTSYILRPTVIEVDSTYTGFSGMKYQQDFGANFTARSIPDVGFVTGLTPNQNVSTNKIHISGTTTLTSNDYIIFCDSTVSGFTVSLPASPVDGQRYKFKDVGDALTNNIIISGNGKTIDTSPFVTINTQRGGLEMIFDSYLDEWFVLNFVG